MDWILLAALGIIWAVLLVPRRRERTDALRDLATLTKMTDHPGTGRHVLMPHQQLLGSSERSRVRLRERRRRVFTVLVEATALTAFIGLVPPLRGMWYLTAILSMLLAAYVWMLLRAREAEGAPAALAPTASPEPAAVAGSAPPLPPTVEAPAPIDIVLPPQPAAAARDRVVVIVPDAIDPQAGAGRVRGVAHRTG